MDTQKTLCRKQARWIAFMQEFNYSIKCIKRTSNIVADSHSRKEAEVHRKSTDTIRKLLSLTRVKASDEVLNELENDM